MHSPAPPLPPQPDEPAADALTGAATALIPLLAEQAAQADACRRLTGTSVSALRRAGLLRLGTPRALNGHGAGVRTAVDVCTDLARGCAAASWFVGIAYGGALFASQLAAGERAALWGHDPDAVVCGTARPSGGAERSNGGFVLNGSWPWISGIHHAERTLLGIAWPTAGDVCERGMALVPTAALTVTDTWHMAGMRGTGSDTAVAENLYVPDARIVSLSAMADDTHQESRSGEPRVTFHLSINLPLVGTGVGIATAVLQHVMDAARGGRRTASPLHGLVAEAPAHQLNVAQAALLIDTAQLHLRRAADEVDTHARQGRRPPPDNRARLRMDAAHAMRCARDAVGLLLDTAGAGSFADGAFLQRAWRDIETASRHAALSQQTAGEIYGRTLLGLSLPNDPAL